MDRPQDTIPPTFATDSDLFRRLFEENTSVMVLFFAESGEIIDVNPAAADFYGHPRDALRGHHLSAIITRERTEFENIVRGISAGSVHPVIPAVHRLASGELRDVVVHPTSMRMDGKLVILSIVRDVTEESRAKRSLLESESRLRAVLDYLPFDVWMCEESGKYVFQNRISIERWGDQTGKTPEETGLPPGVLDLFLSNNRRAFSGETVTGEVTIRISGQTHHYYNVIAPLPLPDGSQGVSGIVGVNVDISDRVQAEDELRAAVAEKELLLREIHHRVKNNLQVIVSLLRLEEHALKDDAGRIAFREARQRIRAMADVHEQLYRSRSFSDIEFGEYLATMARQVVRSSGSSGIELALDLESIKLNIDVAIPCGLIVNELLTNALKHAFNRSDLGQFTLAIDDLPSAEFVPRVRLTFRALDSRTLELAIEDNGAGIPLGTDPGTATSMGMTLIRALVRQISGALTVGAPDAKFSPDRSGVRFSVRFPA